jgi:hypothetical protein
MDYQITFQTADDAGQIKQCQPNQQYHKYAIDGLKRYFLTYPDASFQEAKLTSYNGADNWRQTLEFNFNVYTPCTTDYDDDGDCTMGVPQTLCVKAIWENIGNKRNIFSGFAGEPKLDDGVVYNQSTRSWSKSVGTMSGPYLSNPFMSGRLKF